MFTAALRVKCTTYAFDGLSVEPIKTWNTKIRF